VPFRERQTAAVKTDRWLLSYADFATLLFAVFAALFLLERSGKFTSRQVIEAVAGPRHSMAREAAPAQAPTVTPPEPAAGRVKNPLVTASASLMSELHEDIDRGKVEVRMEAQGLVISLGQAAFFPSGRAEVDPAAYPTVDRLAKLIGRLPNPVRLEGHTDNVRIQNSRFRSNWELSAARSIAVLELLADRGISRNRLSIAGYADTVPITSNGAPEGRAQNRRVDVIVLDPAPLPSPAAKE